MRMLPRLGTVVEAFRVRQKASMTHASSPLLHADRLSVARGDALLIEERSFALQPGEALHVLGENGAGKTTLLRCLMNELSANNGKIQWAENATSTHFGHPRLRRQSTLDIQVDPKMRPQRISDTPAGLAERRIGAVGALGPHLVISLLRAH